MGCIRYLVALLVTGSLFANEVNAQPSMNGNKQKSALNEILYKKTTLSPENLTTLPSQNWLVGIFLIGRIVELPSNISTLVENEGLLGSVYLKYAASEIIISISDINDNNIIKSINLGTRAEGYADFRWDGLDHNGIPMQAGLYKISASANINGRQISVPVLGSFKIKSISHDDEGNIICQIDEYGQVKAKDIVRVY